MAPLRKSISLSELRESRKERGIDDSKYETTYQASRGGWYPDNKPQPADKNNGKGKR